VIAGGSAAKDSTEVTKKKNKYSLKKVNSLFKKTSTPLSSLSLADQQRMAVTSNAADGEGLSVEETNKLRVSMGMKPLKEKKGGVDGGKKSAGGGGTGGREGGAGDESLSVEETNKMRAALGLKPLK
jgi:uncharacterized protein YkwD